MSISKKKILIIEDDNVIRSSLIDVLEIEGYDAVGVEHGQAALEFLSSATLLPSLILLDIMMPIMDGWQFRNNQSVHERFKTIPVVAITADGNAQEKARKMKAEGWVKKPIDIDDLLAAVEKHCA